MNIRKNLIRKIVSNQDLLSQPLPGMPIVELTGYSRVLVENHQGVTQYGRERICIRMRYGFLVVCGSGLELIRMAKQSLVISGTIDSLVLERRIGL